MTESRIGGGETLDGRGLLALSRTITGTLDLQEVLDESFVALRRMISFDGGAIQLIEDGFLRAAATDPPAPPEAYTVRIPVGAGVSGVIAATGEPIYISDITLDARVHPEGRKKGLSGGVRSYFGAPLIEHGVPVGVVQIDSRSVDAFGLVERELVLSFLPTISAAVQNARLFEAEQRAHERIRELERLQRDFLAMVSHELHTPLVKIIGFGDILATGMVDSASEVHQLGEKIGTAGKHLARLIGDVLDVAGIGTVANPREPVPTEVAAILEAALPSVPESEAHRVTVRVAPAAADIDVDPALLARVLGFLLDNALKFSDGPVEVVATRVAPTTVEIAVRDTGEGIAEDLLERVFDRFFQADPSSTRRHGGMGVGLFLARTFCERMGHEIRLESTAGAGTVATVALHGQPDRGRRPLASSGAVDTFAELDRVAASRATSQFGPGRERTPHTRNRSAARPEEMIDMGDAPSNKDEAKGRVKEAAGSLTGDEDMKNEGKVDKAVGGVKDTVDKVADKVKDVFHKD